MLLSPHTISLGLPGVRPGGTEGGRGGTQLMTPMPSLARGGATGGMHASLATITGAGSTTSAGGAAVFAGSDPIGHAQQVVLGVMAALAPAHGGAAAAAVGQPTT